MKSLPGKGVARNSGPHENTSPQTLPTRAGLYNLKKYGSPMVKFAMYDIYLLVLRDSKKVLGPPNMPRYPTLPDPPARTRKKELIRSLNIRVCLDFLFQL